MPGIGGCLAAQFCSFFSIIVSVIGIVVNKPYILALCWSPYIIVYIFNKLILRNNITRIIKDHAHRLKLHFLNGDQSKGRRIPDNPIKTIVSAPTSIIALGIFIQNINLWSDSEWIWCVLFVSVSIFLSVRCANNSI